MTHIALTPSGIASNPATCLNETLDANDHPAFPMNQRLSGDGDIEITRAQNRNYLLGEGFLRLARQSNGWTLFLRYQGVLAPSAHFRSSAARNCSYPQSCH
jgi:hypothetical protein